MLHAFLEVPTIMFACTAHCLSPRSSVDTLLSVLSMRMAWQALRLLHADEIAPAPSVTDRWWTSVTVDTLDLRSPLPTDAAPTGAADADRLLLPG